MPRGPCRIYVTQTFNVPLWGQGSLASPTPLLACMDRGPGAESPVYQSVGWAAPTQHVPSVPTAVLDPCGKGKLRGLWPRTDHYCTKMSHPSPLINELLGKPEADPRLKTFDLPYPSLHHTSPLSPDPHTPNLLAWAQQKALCDYAYCIYPKEKPFPDIKTKYSPNVN